MGSHEVRTLLSSIVAGGRLTLSARVLSAADVDLAELLNVLRTGTVEAPVWWAGQWRYRLRIEGNCAIVALRLQRLARHRSGRRWLQADTPLLTAAVVSWIGRRGVA